MFLEMEEVKSPPKEETVNPRYGPKVDILSKASQVYRKARQEVLVSDCLVFQRKDWQIDS